MLQDKALFKLQLIIHQFVFCRFSYPLSYKITYEKEKERRIVLARMHIRGLHATFSSSCSPGYISDSFTYLRDSPAGESLMSPSFLRPANLLRRTGVLLKNIPRLTKNWINIISS